MGSDRHVTDEEILELGGSGKPRYHPAVPQAICTLCGDKHDAFYATFAHDCRLDLKERKPYGVWLILFQRWGWGVLKSPSSKKVAWDHRISGQNMLTHFLQSELFVGPGYELIKDWYFSDVFKGEGFPDLAWSENPEGVN